MPVRIVSCPAHNLVAIPIIQWSIVLILDMTFGGLMAENIKITNVWGPALIIAYCISHQTDLGLSQQENTGSEIWSQDILTSISKNAAVLQNECHHPNEMIRLIFYPVYVWQSSENKFVLEPLQMRWDTSVDIAVGCGLDGRCSIPGRGKIYFSFPQHPHWLRDPPSILFHGYLGLFPWG